MIAGIWSEWTDPTTGEIVPNFALITFNANSHPLLKRLHRPEVDKATRRPLSPELQDKRGEAHIQPECWMKWLTAGVDAAMPMLVAPPVEFFDLSDATAMDQLLTEL